MQTIPSQLSEVSQQSGINPPALGVTQGNPFAQIGTVAVRAFLTALASPQVQNLIVSECERLMGGGYVAHGTNGATGIAGEGDWKQAITQMFADGKPHTTEEIRAKLNQGGYSVPSSAWLNWLNRKFEAVTGQRGTYKAGSAKH